MIYRFQDLVPANTAKADARVKTLKLTRGVIHRVNFYFPPGCNGLAHIQVLQGVHQVWPTNPQGSFAGNDESIDFDEYQEIPTSPYIMVMRTWNTDTVYDHKVILRIGILPRWAVLPVGATEGLVQSLKSLIVGRPNG